jgi:predicted PurR-regulated permease PerM
VATGLSSPIAALLRLVSRVACLIVLASFAIFVVHQATNASNHQQNEVNNSGPASSATASLPTINSNQKSTAHRVIDEASEQITSPFSSITSGFNSQWGTQMADLALTLLLYGFGLSFLARALRA